MDAAINRNVLNKSSLLKSERKSKRADLTWLIVTVHFYVELGDMGWKHNCSIMRYEMLRIKYTFIIFCFENIKIYFLLVNLKN